LKPFINNLNIFCIFKGMTTTESSETTTDMTTMQSTTDRYTTTNPNEEMTTTTSNQETTTNLNTETTTDNSETTTESNSETTTDRRETTIDASTTDSNSGGTTTDAQTTDSMTTTTEQTTSRPSNGNSSCPPLEEGQAHFVCPTGFRRHPQDCQMFYQCTQSPETSHLSIVTFNCPNNTVYDEDAVQCRDKQDDDNCPSKNDNSQLRGILFGLDKEESPLVRRKYS
jgi:hypothetical protein